MWFDVWINLTLGLLSTKYLTYGDQWERGHADFDVLLAVHLSTTLVNDQLDVQFFYFIIRILQSSTCFEQRRAHHREVKLY